MTRPLIAVGVAAAWLLIGLALAFPRDGTKVVTVYPGTAPASTTTVSVPTPAIVDQNCLMYQTGMVCTPNGGAGQ